VAENQLGAIAAADLKEAFARKSDGYLDYKIPSGWAQGTTTREKYWQWKNATGLILSSRNDETGKNALSQTKANLTIVRWSNRWTVTCFRL